MKKIVEQKKALKFLYENVRARGLKAASKRALIKDMLIKIGPDVIPLGNMGLNRNFKSIWSSRRIGWVVLDVVGSTGRIIILWKEDYINVRDSLLGSFSVTISFTFNNSFSG